MAAVILAIVLVTTVATDIKERRIPNVIVLPATLLGLIVNAFRPGGLSFSLEGLGIGFIVMFVLYMLGAISAGDVKLSAAVGALAGPLFAIGELGWTILISSVVGIAFMLVSGRGNELVKYTFTYFKYILLKAIHRDLKKEPLAKAEVSLPFAVFITAGCVLEYLFPGVMLEWFIGFTNALATMSVAL